MSRTQQGTRADQKGGTGTATGIPEPLKADPEVSPTGTDFVRLALHLDWDRVPFFVRYLEMGGQASFVPRPPGVEGFLPISSLMSLHYLFLSGEIHPAHPAGLLILVAVIVISFVFGKSFCSWLCPIGLLSESLGDLGEKIFRRKIHIPRFLDYPLRSLKYLLLGFFVYSIFFVMGEVALRAFLDSPYNLTADIKMYYFFADISRFALIVIITLIVLSIPIRNFWCRYLCPYGAFLGIFSLLSPHKIKRNPTNCIDCGECAYACPSRIKVDKVHTVVSDECVTCLNCVDVCPVAHTLEVKSLVTRRPIAKHWVAIATVGLFVMITGAAMLAGKWQNKVSIAEYLYHQQFLKSYGHPTSARELSRLERDNNSVNPGPDKYTTDESQSAIEQGGGKDSE